MNKCVRIAFNGTIKENFLNTIILKHARKLNIEGFAQVIPPSKIKIVACGIKEQVDEFIDLVHKEIAAFQVQELEVEPFLKDKDYRGVFRVIE